MDILSVLVSLVSGVAGGNAAGAAIKDKGLGPLGNSIAGLVGGGVGGTLLPALLGMATTPGGANVAGLLGDALGGGAGGAGLTLVVALLKNAMSRA
jgi:uncharacterized membrane protein YeaQ/YmgE (transglycosylase-associated protein family)